MHINSMPTFITNHPIHVSCQGHTELINSSPYNQILHAYSHTSYFKQSKPVNHTTNNNYVRKQHGLRQVSFKLGVLAQARGVLSFKLQALAQASIRTQAQGGFAKSRLGKAISPERDGASLKTQFFRLSECSSKNPQASFCYTRLGKTSSLGRKQQFSLTIPPLQSQRFIQNSKQCIFIPS